MKKTFILYLKSHSEEPDFEREVKAENKEEALEILRMKYPLLNEYPDEYLLEHLYLDETQEDTDKLMEIFYPKRHLDGNDDREIDRAVDLEVDKLMEENEEVSEDYPLGGMIEPYDIWKEDELIK